MSRGAPFLTTRWSLVLSTRGTSTEAKRALDELCVAYWFPLFVHAKRSGLSGRDARDTVQGFIAQLLQGGGLDGVEPTGGRFRAYLLGALRHFTLAEHRARRTAKRDGGPIGTIGGPDLPMDLAGAARRYDGSRFTELSPEEAFDRAWAQEIIAAATARLREEYVASGKLALFEVLADTLDGSGGAMTHGERASTIGCTVGAMKVAAHRLRGRLGELIRAEVSHTLEEPGGLEEELGLLIQALRGKT